MAEIHDSKILDIINMEENQANAKKGQKQPLASGQPNIVQNGQQSTVITINNSTDIGITTTENETNRLLTEIEYLKKLIEEKDNEIKLLKDNIELLKSK